MGVKINASQVIKKNKAHFWTDILDFAAERSERLLLHLSAPQICGDGVSVCDTSAEITCPCVVSLLMKCMFTPLITEKSQTSRCLVNAVSLFLCVL